MLWGCKGKELRGDPIEVAHIYPLESLVPVTTVSSIHRLDQDYSLFQAKIPETTQILFFRFPYSIHNILHINDIIRLTVTSVSERHQWWVCLRNGC